MHRQEPVVSITASSAVSAAAVEKSNRHLLTNQIQDFNSAVVQTALKFHYVFRKSESAYYSLLAYYSQVT